MNIPFVKYNNLGFIASSVLIVIACISLMFKGLNLGLDFTGGVSLEIKYDQKADLSKIRNSLSKIENANFVVLNFGSDDKVLIKFQSDSELNITADTVLNRLRVDQGAEFMREHFRGEKLEKFEEMLKKNPNLIISEELVSDTCKPIPNDCVNPFGEILKSETIFPQIGEELRDKGGIAILVAMLVILVYIIFRFQIKFGYGAIAALFHDVFIILGIFSVFNLAFDLSVLAAILAIVGYSLNDSIVVSDRIRENFLDPNKKGSSEVLINDSLNQVFARTIITSFTTLLVLMALLFAGGEALKNFSLALAIGVVIGSYSSIFIVVKVLLATNLSKKDMEKPKNEPEESYSLD